MSAADTVDDGEVVTIHGHATEMAGRFVVTAGELPFLTDTRVSAGGPGQAVQAGQLLLSSLASCGLGLIQGYAAERGIALTSADVQASFKRNPDDKTRYRYIRLDFRLGGVKSSVAEELLAHFTQNCPIFNTLRRGGEVQARLVAVP